MTRTVLNLKTLIASALAVGAISSPVVLASAQAHPVKQRHAPARKHHKAARHSKIPQHNGGDHDSDNNGGPTDGDGNV